MMRRSSTAVALSASTSLALAAFGVSACFHPAPQPLTRCTSTAQSSIAWRQNATGAELVGRVVQLDGTTPVRDARVLLEPGQHTASTLLDGSFRLVAPAGVYRLRIQSIGRVEARDSVVLTGRNSLQMLVTLVEPDVGLREC
jgi:hypothetical protein